MTKQFHGITSVGLAGLAVGIAAVTMFRTSWVLGVAYLLICVAAAPTILYAYCAKCPCQAHCAHVLPGRVAMLFGREPGPYTKTEMTAMVLSLLLLLGFPQFWLWRYIGLFIAFWALMGVAVLQIRTVICRVCANVYCPLKIKA